MVTDAGPCFISDGDGCEAFMLARSSRISPAVTASITAPFGIVPCSPCCSGAKGRNSSARPWLWTMACVQSNAACVSPPLIALNAESATCCWFTRVAESKRRTTPPLCHALPAGFTSVMVPDADALLAITTSSSTLTESITCNLTGSPTLAVFEETVSVTMSRTVLPFASRIRSAGISTPAGVSTNVPGLSGCTSLSASTKAFTGVPATRTAVNRSGCAPQRYLCLSSLQEGHAYVQFPAVAPGIRLLGINNLADCPRTGFGDHGVANDEVFRKHKFHHVAFFGGPGVHGFGELQRHLCAFPQDQLRTRRWRSAASRAAWIGCLLGTSRRQKQ